MDEDPQQEQEPRTRPSRRDVLRGAAAITATAAIPLLLKKVHAQEAPRVPETIPFAQLQEQIRGNLRTGTTELAFEHTPLDSNGNVKILGIAEGDIDRSPFLQKAVDHLKANPEETAVAIGHTHPPLVYGRERGLSAQPPSISRRMLGLPPETPSEPSEEEKRKYEKHAVPFSHDDAGTYLLEYYRAKKEGVLPQKLLFSAYDARGTWTALDRTQSAVEQISKQYNLPAEMFSKSPAETNAAFERIRNERDTLRREIFAEAVRRVRDPAVQERLYEIENPPFRQDGRALPFPESLFGDHKKNAVQQWFERSRRYNFRTFPESWMNIYLRLRGHTSLIQTEPVVVEHSLDDHTLKAFRILFDNDVLQRYVQLSRNYFFIRDHATHYNVFMRRPDYTTRDGQVRPGHRLQAELLKREEGVPDSEADFATIALHMRGLLRQRGSPSIHALADVSAKIRTDFPNMTERDIITKIMDTEEYARYRVQMAQRYGLSVTYHTHADYENFLRDREQLRAFISAN